MDESWPWTEAPVCLVTGAARGLGAEVARALADRGATVLAAARDAAGTDAGDGRLRALPDALDITDPDAVEAAAGHVRREFGRLDVLVNNAAAYVDWGETTTGADLARARQVMDTNLFGTWRVTQAFLPLLRESAHPRVVVLASGAGSHGDEAYGLAARGGLAASYGISKAALLALTAALAAELADTRVVVNAVDPGLTATWPGAETMGARPAAESAAGVVWAATLPDDGPRGGFFRDGVPHPW